MPPRNSTAKADKARRHLSKLARQGPDDIRLGLERMTAALAALAHPETKLPPVIHVAGTNGKGSVIAFLRAILEAGGYQVHSFTSPALGRAGEQINCAGQAIGDGDLEALVAQIARCAPGALTPFEMLTLSGFLAFSRTPADFLLLETGMGGADDATNVVRYPALTVITPVALDHIRYLGPDLAAIARAKAGIFKPRVPAVLGPQCQIVRDVFEEEAARRGVRLIRHGQEWMAFAQGGRLVFQDESGLLDLPLPALAGRHQIDNAGTALASLRALASLGLPESALETGLKSVHWPGRLEPIRSGALLEALPGGSEAWIDVGHNPHAASALAEFLADREDREPKPLILVVGMLDGKDAAGFFQPFLGLAARTIVVPLRDDSRAQAPESLCEAARAAGQTATIATSLDEVLVRITDDLEGPVRLLFCGSFAIARFLENRSL